MLSTSNDIITRDTWQIDHVTASRFIFQETVESVRLIQDSIQLLCGPCLFLSQNDVTNNNYTVEGDWWQVASTPDGKWPKGRGRVHQFVQAALQRWLSSHGSSCQKQKKPSKTVLSSVPLPFLIVNFLSTQLNSSTDYTCMHGLHFDPYKDR